MKLSLAQWCGGVLIWTAAMTPILAYFGPLGFAVLAAVSGLLMLPALRIEKADRPVAAVLAAGLAWAWLSMLWSPMKPEEFEDNVAAKLTLMAPLFWALWCGARRADPRLGAMALRILGWGMAAFGAVLIVEAATGAGVYRAIHQTFYEPIRPDLAMKNLGRSTFVLALIWPLAALGAARAGAPRWLAAPMLIGMALAAHRFGSDAPLLSPLIAALAAWIVWRWPQKGPNVLSWAAASFFLFMPAVVMAGRVAGVYVPLQNSLQKSWALRMEYWSNAVDLAGPDRLRGLGLDASRTFPDLLSLHPHNGSLQMWLELGLPGALLAALFWGLSLRRLSGPVSGWAAPATAAATFVYLLFGAVNFGLWQEWWIALGAMVAAFAALQGRLPPRAFERTAA
jgi:hypothetical protein